METLTLEQFNYIAEIVSSVAVIASLIYIAIEIRQNTNTVKLNSAQNLFHEYRDSLALIITNPDVCDIHVRAMTDIESLSPVEKHRFYMLANNFFRVFENAYYHNSLGSVDKIVWDGMLAAMKIGKDTTGYQLFWHERKFIFNEEFQEFYDGVEGYKSILDIYHESKPNS